MRTVFRRVIKQIKFMLNLKKVIILNSIFYLGVANAIQPSAASAEELISHVRETSLSCPTGASNLQIAGVKLGTAADHNRMQALNEYKKNGVKGKSYAIISANVQGKPTQIYSMGPLASGVGLTDLQPLLKLKLCIVDES